MKVVRYYAPEKVRVEEVAEPSPGSGELKMRVRSCSICGTDLKIVRYGSHRIDPPRTIGHEITGEIVEVGADVDGWAVGDRIQVIGAIPCGQCRDCTNGRMTVCPYLEAMGYHYDGGFAEYLVVPEKVLAVGGVHRIPDGVGFAEASVAEPLACVINAQELIRVGPGDEVVVVGGGPVGCLHVRLARARGAARVILIELSPERLARAVALVEPDEAICASEVDVVKQVLAVTGGRGADVVITATASAEAQTHAVQYTASRGRISLFGGLPYNSPMTTIDANIVHYRELTIMGANSSYPEQNARALELIATGAIRVDDLITHRMTLDEFPDAIQLLEKGEAMKVTIEP